MSYLEKQLTEYAGSDSYPFHMPGHKRGISERISAGEALEAFYGIDITEITGFDDLHHPQGLLKEARERASDLYGSDHSYYLVNGSTAGILSAVSSAALTLRKKTGDDVPGTLLISRNCHRSVYHASWINRLDLNYLYPEYDPEYRILNGVSPEKVRYAIEKALGDGAHIAAVVITSPTYEGVVSDIGSIAKIVHQYEIPLIVDEAHGAHFGFCQGFPDHSVHLGADLVVHSVHKTLYAPTQTALIHLNGMRIEKEDLERYLRVYQTSSPSYPLMAGIDTALCLMADRGKELLEEVKNLRSRIQSGIRDLRYVRICPYTEPGKLLLFIDRHRALYYRENGEKKPFHGRALFSLLRDRYLMEAEMSSPDHVLCILTVGDTEEGADRLIRALCEIDTEIEADEGEQKTEYNNECYISEPAQTAVPFFRAVEMTGKKCPLDQAAGHTAADFIHVYPPGSPMIVSGEILTDPILRGIRTYLDAGFEVQGVTGDTVKVL